MTKENMELQTNKSEEYPISTITKQLDNIFLKALEDDRFVLTMHDKCKGYNPTCICIRGGYDCPREKKLKLQKMKEILS